MKKKMVWIVGAIVATIVIVGGVALVVRYINLRNAVPIELDEREGISYSANDVSMGDVSELIAEVQSEEEAREIADLYGITLKQVNSGLAVFVTEEEPQSVIKRGEENGWTKLYANTIYYFNDETAK